MLFLRKTREGSSGVIGFVVSEIWILLFFSSSGSVSVSYVVVVASVVIVVLSLSLSLSPQHHQFLSVSYEHLLHDNHFKFRGTKMFLQLQLMKKICIWHKNLFEKIHSKPDACSKDGLWSAFTSQSVVIVVLSLSLSLSLSPQHHQFLSVSYEHLLHDHLFKFRWSSSMWMKAMSFPIPVFVSYVNFLQQKNVVFIPFGDIECEYTLSFRQLLFYKCSTVISFSFCFGFCVICKFFATEKRSIHPFRRHRVWVYLEFPATAVLQV